MYIHNTIGMYYEDDFLRVNEPNDYGDDDFVKTHYALENVKKADKGYVMIRRRSKKIELYVSGGKGSRIRDAETGFYYPNLVGSKDEDIFFKMSLATGECAKCTSNTFFFVSPNHYEKIMNEHVGPPVFVSWQEKCNARLRELKYNKKVVNQTIVVK